MDLLNWRKEKGLSGLKFSKLSGIPISTIVKHEAGKKTRKETLCKRPVDYRSYIGRFGLFYDSNEDCSYFGMLTSIQNGFQ